MSCCLSQLVPTNKLLPCVHTAQNPRAAQHSTAQRSAAQRSTAQHSTAQHSTAQHSTAQHSAAQRSAAQHSAAQRSTAQQSAAHQHITSQHSTPHHASDHTARQHTLPRSALTDDHARAASASHHPTGYGHHHSCRLPVGSFSRWSFISTVACGRGRARAQCPVTRRVQEAPPGMSTWLS
jgi:hypothetical protein